MTRRFFFGLLELFSRNKEANCQQRASNCPNHIKEQPGHVARRGTELQTTCLRGEQLDPLATNLAAVKYQLRRAFKLIYCILASNVMILSQWTTKTNHCYTNQEMASLLQSDALPSNSQASLTNRCPLRQITDIAPTTVGSKSIQPPWRFPLTAIVNKSFNIVCCVYNSNILNHPKYDFFKV